MKWSEFINLPWVELSDDRARARFGNNKFAAAAIDVLDGDLWGSKTSVIGNIVIMNSILVSAIIYVFTNGNDVSIISPAIHFIELGIGVLLTVEVVLRMRFAKFLGHSNARVPVFALLSLEKMKFS